jgi:hypothetical protein
MRSPLFQDLVQKIKQQRFSSEQEPDDVSQFLTKSAVCDNPDVRAEVEKAADIQFVGSQIFAAGQRQRKRVVSQNPKAKKIEEDRIKAINESSSSKNLTPKLSKPFSKEQRQLLLDQKLLLEYQVANQTLRTQTLAQKKKDNQRQQASIFLGPEDAYHFKLLQRFRQGFKIPLKALLDETLIAVRLHTRKGKDQAFDPKDCDKFFVPIGDPNKFCKNELLVHKAFGRYVRLHLDAQQRAASEEDRVFANSCLTGAQNLCDILSSNQAGDLGAPGVSQLTAAQQHQVFDACQEKFGPCGWESPSTARPIDEAFMGDSFLVNLVNSLKSKNEIDKAVAKLASKSKEVTRSSGQEKNSASAKTKKADKKKSKGNKANKDSKEASSKNKTGSRSSAIMKFFRKRASVKPTTDQEERIKTACWNFHALGPGSCRDKNREPISSEDCLRSHLCPICGSNHSSTQASLSECAGAASLDLPLE